MQDSLRKALIDSHVVAITIAILIFSSLEAALLALWSDADILLTNLANTGSPFNLHFTVVFLTGNLLPVTLSSLFLALINLLAAWLLSRWTYGVGPLRSLGSYRDKLSRKIHA